jgi:holo-[acyl-carrier protein] synthase
VTGQVLGLGLDLVDIDRFGAALLRRSSMAERLFTPEERDLVVDMVNPTPTLAGRFAVKEATMKALGVGMGAIDWADVTTLRLEGGAPSLSVTGRAARLADERGISSWQVSISHTDTMAAAVVLALS